MTMLAPLFLLGLLLLALPWWLHRIQTEIPETEAFPSTMLLEASKKRVHVRKQLRYLLLLASRLLFLLLLVLAFARPTLEQKSAVLNDDTQVHLIVIDSSASMTAAGSIGAARTLANRLVNQLPGDSVAQIISAGTTLQTASELSNDRAVLRNGIASIEASPVALNYSAVMSGIDQLMQADVQNYQLHFVSDFQNTAMPSRFSDLVPTGNGRNYQLNLHSTAVSQQGNRAIESVQTEQGGLSIVVRSWQAETAEVTLSVKVNNRPTQSTSIEAPGNGRISAVFDQLELEDGNNEVVVEIVDNDAVLLDNTYFYAIDRTPAAPVLLLTNEPNGRSATYLGAVFSEARDDTRNAPEFTLQTENINNFDLRRLERYRWVIIDDIGNLQGDMGTALNDYLDAGGAIFAASGERSRSLNDIPLLGLTTNNTNFQQQQDFKSVSHTDSTHPVLNSLKGWSDITISDHISVESGATDQVLISLDNGDPLLLEPARDKGRLVWLASSLDNNWNNLPLKPLFVGFMSEMARYLSNTQRLDTQQFAGQHLGIAKDAGNYGQLIDPDGNKALGLGETLNSSALQLKQTGFYELINASGNQLIGVNIDPKESDLASIDAAKLEQWQTAATRIQQTASVDGQALNTDRKMNEFWMVLFALAVLLLIFESIFANFNLRQAASSGTT